MGKFRDRNRKRARKQNEAPAKQNGWRENKNGAEDPIILRQNELFENFYRAQNLVSDSEWTDFMDALRRDLPQSFRFVGCKKEGELLMEILKERYLSKVTDVEVDGKKMEPPKTLPWYPGGLAFQLNLPRRVLRKHDLLNNLHNFLVTESELGHLSRQESVSMIPPLLLDINSSSRVFDMCAAPGSKTAQLIEMLHGEDETKVPSGFVLANDENNKRCYLLVHQSLKRLNSPCCLIVNNDAAAMPYPKVLLDNDMIESVRFDQILCDVPCSGDGTLRKNFAIWKTWSPYHGYNLHRLQTRIAKRGLEMLQVGGSMVYSTCSLNPAENEATIASLLNFAQGSVELVDISTKLQGLNRSAGLHTWKLMDKEGNFYESFEKVPEDKRRYFPDSAFPPENSVSQQMKLERCMRILPHQQDTGGFFVALLRKTSEFPWTKENQFLKPLNIGHIKPAASSIISVDNNDNDSVNGSSSSPPRKQRRFRGYKEDPFVFLSKDDIGWKAVEAYFDISPGFPVCQLLRRGFEANKKRNLYFVNDITKRVIENNNDNMKLINAGTRLFSRVDVKETDSQIRLTQDGVNILLPYMRKRIVEIPRDELVDILTKSKKNCYSLDNFSSETKARFEPWGEGSVVLLCKFEESDIAVCAWRGKCFVSPYLAKESVVHVLRMLRYDTTECENEMMNAKRRNNKALKTLSDPNGSTTIPAEEEETIECCNVEEEQSDMIELETASPVVVTDGVNV